MNANTKMTVKRLWTTVCVLALALASFILVSPRVFAQTSAAERGDTEKKSNTKAVSDYGDLIGNVLDFVWRQYVDTVDPEVLYRGAMKGMLDSLGDPYTIYLDSDMMRDLNDVTKGNFGGVGLSISKPMETTIEKPAYVDVASPIEDTPGWRAGILSGDQIVSINGTFTPEITLNQVLDMLRGPAGTSVDLVIKRGKTMEFPVTIVRDMIEVPTVKYGMIGDVGYIRIIEFSKPTALRVQEALDSFAKTGYKSLVIDLRNNPGGLITSVVEVADKFIDSGVIVSTKSRLKYDNVTFNASSRKTTVPKGTPTVVLINRGSASASEILSGALKDYRLAYLLGERTYGKGSVQKPVPLPNDDGLKLTTARYYTPTDTNIDKIGIPPDRAVSLLDLSEEEEKTYVAILTSDTIKKYVADHSNMDEAAIKAGAETLGHDWALDSRLLRRLLRVETNRLKSAELYDLDYDVQLSAALNLLHTEDFAALMKTTKTLQDLQHDTDLMAEKK